MPPSNMSPPRILLAKPLHNIKIEEGVSYMKKKSLLLTLVLCFTLGAVLVGCSAEETDDPAEQPASEAPAEQPGAETETEEPAALEENAEEEADAEPGVSESEEADAEAEEEAESNS